MKTVRLIFTLPIPLEEKVRKEAYVKKSTKSSVVRSALEEYFKKKQYGPEKEKENYCLYCKDCLLYRFYTRPSYQIRGYRIYFNGTS